MSGRGTDFFISHAGRDTGWAEWLAWQLQQAGYTVELDVWDWAPGEDFVARMAAALESAQRSLREVMSTVVGAADAVAASSEELSASSAQISASAEETSAQSGVVAGAAEERGLGGADRVLGVVGERERAAANPKS